MQSKAQLLSDWIANCNGAPISAQKLSQCTKFFRRNRQNFTDSGKLHFVNANFDNQDLSDISLKGLSFLKCSFANTKVSKVDFLYFCHMLDEFKAPLSQFDISCIDFSNTDLSIYNLSGVSFKGSKMNKVTLFSLIEQACVKKVDLSGVDFSNQNLSGGYIKNDLLGISCYNFFDLSGLNLDNCNFHKCNMEGIKIIRSTLRNANLEAVNMKMSIISESDFTGANLKSSNLMHSIFSDTILDKIDLSGAKI